MNKHGAKRIRFEAAQNEGNFFRKLGTHVTKSPGMPVAGTPFIIINIIRMASAGHALDVISANYIGLCYLW